MLLTLLTLTLVPQFNASLRTGGDMDVASKSYSAAATVAVAGTMLHGLNRGLMPSDCPHLLMQLTLLTLLPQLRANLRIGGDMDAVSKSYSAAAVAAAASTTLHGLNR